jgi:hypothetical protein
VRFRVTSGSSGIDFDAARTGMDAEPFCEKRQIFGSKRLKFCEPRALPGLFLHPILHKETGAQWLN